MCCVKKSTKVLPEHVDGVMNCPVGLTISGPDSLREITRNCVFFFNYINLNYFLADSATHTHTYTYDSTTSSNSAKLFGHSFGYSLTVK